MNKIINNIQKYAGLPDIKQYITEGEFGIEKENLRVNDDGSIAKTAHPDNLGCKNCNPYITNDFAENQIEMICPPMRNIREAYGFIGTIHDIVSENIGDELLWPQSLPGIINSEDEIKVATFGEKGVEKDIYRQKLVKIYGKTRQMISGVHFNVSLPESLVLKLHSASKSPDDINIFRDKLYLKMTRNFLRYRWFLIYLYGQSPVAHESFKIRSLKTDEIEVPDCPNGTSLRNSTYGYRNKEELNISYKSVQNYRDEIDDFVKAGKLIDDKELYQTIRIKFNGQKEHISYIELRLPDLDPLEKIGLSLNTLHFFHLFLIYTLLTPENDDFSKEIQDIATSNSDIISCEGNSKDIKICNFSGQKVYARQYAREIFSEIEKIYKDYDINKYNLYNNAFEQAKFILENPEERPYNKILKEIKKEGFIKFHIKRAKKYKQESKAENFRFFGFEDFELSTQLLLKAAVKRGLTIDILDRKENFIRLSSRNKTEYIMQATRTSLDRYSSILVMENKVITKKVLKENNINVPEGKYYNSVDKAKSDFWIFKGRPVVIKPKSTNFGLGINILKENNDNALFNRAVDFAFEQEDSVLIEDFFSGREFRVFIIGDEVVGILHRVPANVTGDGKSTIIELVVVKNKNPLRGKGYKTPLEKINLGEAEEIFLKLQNLTFDSIVKKDETVYLRENSNISTGGDSIDYTDDIHESYKKIAVDAAKALGVKITGLDMIIKDTKVPATKDNYTIIELNFNPAIHIHCYPFIGKNRYLNEKILDALEFKVASGGCK